MRYALLSLASLILIASQAKAEMTVHFIDVGQGGGVLGIGFGTFMAIACLIIYFVANRTGSEFQKEQARIQCPQCAEFIAIGAQKCRFCGSLIQAKS